MAKKQSPKRPPATGLKNGSNREKSPSAGKGAKKAAHAKSPSQTATGPAAERQPAGKDRSEDSSFPLVGIGASAGGLDAFTKLLENLPPDTGMAFVLVQHLAPTKDSILAEILAKATPMPVREIEDGMAVGPNQVYVIPPNTALTVSHGILQLHRRAEFSLRHMPVDSFFLSLAEDRGQHAVGIILSGTGSDGALGIRAIKAEGGLILAQDEQSAKYDGMPKSAAATGVVDFILPPDKIAAELVRISHLPATSLLADMQPGPLLQAGAGELNKLFMLVRTATGADFTHYKQATILRRISRRMHVNKIEDLDHYVRYLQENPSEVGALYQDILINVTSFFRDPETFDALKKGVFPHIVEKQSSETPLRVWVPGCSTGEEVYSLAICFSEWSEERSISHPIHFFASDIDEAAIGKARTGFYPATITQDVSPERLRSFFTRTEQGYQIKKAIRDQCIFARQNLIKDPPFSKIDLISCRNLMIYFGPLLQKKTLPILHYALNNGGYLMLGRSESIGEFVNLFSLVDKNNRIYSKRITSSELHFERVRDPVQEKAGVKNSVEAYVAGTDIQKEADSIILKKYNPAGLVMNEDMDILQFRGNVSPYLKPQPGKASLNLMRMAGEDLAVALRLLIRQAAGKESAVRKEGVKVWQNNALTTMTIEMTALKARDSAERLFLVIFEEAAGVTGGGAFKPGKVPAKTKGRSREDQAASLARELAATQQHLKAVIAEYEASTEELKALNEEVQSSNEELQSLNEELETSKEELQSTNEELGTVNDELQNRNEAITQSNNDLINVLRGVEIPILLIGNTLRIRRFNPSAGKALNLIEGDIGRPLSDIRPNINVPDLGAMILEVIDSMSIRKQEIQDLQGRWYIMTIRPYRTDDNKIDGALVTIEDINDLKLGMRRIQEAREYAEAIVETVREPLIILGKDLQVITANRAYYTNFAVTPGMIEHKYFFDLQDGLWNVPGLRQMVEELFGKNDAFSDFEVDYEAPGDGRRTLFLNGRRIAREGAALILLAVEDLTDRRLAEERIQKLNRDLQHHLDELASANKEMEAFSFSVSHDLRAPLTRIVGFSDVLLQDYSEKIDEKGKKHLNRILSGAAGMSRIIDDLLHLSRLSRQEVQREDLNLSAIAASIVTALRETQPDRRAVVAIQEGVTAFADAKLIEVALTNLLGNAWKFTAKTENARIEFGMAEREGKTVYSVKDNGAGFDQAFSEKLFLPFQRLHSEQEFEGTGIGLAIVERVIRRHGGAIWAEGKTNEGAVFFFTLPQ